MNAFNVAWDSLRKAWYDSVSDEYAPDSRKEQEEADLEQFMQPVAPQSPEEAAILQALKDKYGDNEVAQEMFEMMLEERESGLGSAKEEGELMASPDVGGLGPAVDPAEKQNKPPSN